VQIASRRPLLKIAAKVVLIFHHKNFFAVNLSYCPNFLDKKKNVANFLPVRKVAYAFFGEEKSIAEAWERRRKALYLSAFDGVWRS